MSIKKPKKPTIYDLADLAGVSKGTVSRVLNNKDRVNPKTRAKILEIAHEIGLKPRATARNKEIAVITDPHYTDRFRGYAATLTAHVAFALSARNASMRLPSDPIKQLPNYFIDGIIAITYEPEIQTLLQGLEAKIPVVYLDNFEPLPNQYVIRSDHYQSGYKAARHFIERGITKLGYVSGNNLPARIRWQGYSDAIKEAGLPFDQRVYAMMEEGDSLFTQVNRVIQNGAKALYAPGTSMQGIEALHVLQNVMGLRIPEDISIIGGENTGISIFQHPPMTTLSEPLEDMAQTAVDMVLALSNNEVYEQHVVTFPSDLIERKSVS